MKKKKLCEPMKITQLLRRLTIFTWKKKRANGTKYLWRISGRLHKSKLENKLLINWINWIIEQLFRQNHYTETKKRNEMKKKIIPTRANGVIKSGKRWKGNKIFKLLNELNWNDASNVKLIIFFLPFEFFVVPIYLPPN